MNVRVSCCPPSFTTMERRFSKGGICQHEHYSLAYTCRGERSASIALDRLTCVLPSAKTTSFRLFKGKPQREQNCVSSSRLTCNDLLGVAVSQILPLSESLNILIHGLKICLCRKSSILQIIGMRLLRSRRFCSKQFFHIFQLFMNGSSWRGSL